MNKILFSNYKKLTEFNSYLKIYHKIIFNFNSFLLVYLPWWTILHMLGTLVFMDGISPVGFPIKHKQILFHLAYCISSGMVYKK